MWDGTLDVMKGKRKLCVKKQTWDTFKVMGNNKFLSQSQGATCRGPKPFVLGFFFSFFLDIFLEREREKRKVTCFFVINNIIIVIRL